MKSSSTLAAFIAVVVWMLEVNRVDSWHWRRKHSESGAFSGLLTAQKFRELEETNQQLSSGSSRQGSAFSDIFGFKTTGKRFSSRSNRPSILPWPHDNAFSVGDDYAVSNDISDYDDSVALDVTHPDSPYGLIQDVLPSKTNRKRPQEVAVNQLFTHPGVPAEDVWLNDGALLVLRGGTTNSAESPTWPPLDDYQAPYREPILAPSNILETHADKFAGIAVVKPSAEPLTAAGPTAKLPSLPSKPQPSIQTVTTLPKVLSRTPRLGFIQPTSVPKRIYFSEGWVPSSPNQGSSSSLNFQSLIRKPQQPQWQQHQQSNQRIMNGEGDHRPNYQQQPQLHTLLSNEDYRFQVSPKGFEAATTFKPSYREPTRYSDHDAVSAYNSVIGSQNQYLPVQQTPVATRYPQPQQRSPIQPTQSPPYTRSVQFFPSSTPPKVLTNAHSLTRTRHLAPEKSSQFRVSESSVEDKREDYFYIVPKQTSAVQKRKKTERFFYNRQKPPSSSDYPNRKRKRNRPRFKGQRKHRRRRKDNRIKRGNRRNHEDEVANSIRIKR